MYRVIETKDNKVNLCDSCKKTYPDCDCRNILFGDGKGEDNICCCNAYMPKDKEAEDAD